MTWKSNFEETKKHYTNWWNQKGIVLTMWDPRNRLAHQVADQVRQHFHVFESLIPRNVRLSEAPSHGLPALLYDVQSKGAQGYLSLAREVIEATP